MDSVYCGICRRKVSLDEDHVRVDAEIVRTRDRDEADDYIVHTDCWRSLTEGWMTPA
jgi:hypothetical protein